MPSEMLSGPDLGGGYLHQLTLDRDGERTTFTFHAQDGGEDAGGPSKGPLDRLGWTHPPLACAFGGPRCWHRRFLLPFAELPRVRAAYNRTRFVMQTMLDQAYDSAVPAIGPTLTEVAQRVDGPLASEGIAWHVGGSAAAWLLGVRIPPRDIDLGTTRRGVDRLAELLRDYLIEPLGPTDRPGRGIVHGARAFVGTFVSGARVDWFVSLDPGAGSEPREGGPDPAEVRTVPVSFEGTTFRAARLEYALVRACEAGETDRVPALIEATKAAGVERPLLEPLLDRSRLDPAERVRLLHSLGV